MFKGIFLFSVLAILLIRCSSKEHLAFDKIMMDGRIEKFAGELTKSGYVVTDSLTSHSISLKGKFLNKECQVIVLGTEKNNLAYKVVVSMPVEVHDSLQANFGKIQNLFTLKYGAGYSKYQQYKKRERLVYKVPERNVMAGDFTKYITDSGEITLEVMKGYISITYLDQMNHEIWEKETE
jgi:hypothetical protein